MDDTIFLAEQATSLSNKLHSFEEKYRYESTIGDVSSIADELERLSTTLKQLDEAINAKPGQYTSAFNEDLNEITTELISVFEEISECCEEIQRADSKVSTVSWFFKKGRVTRLLKHIEALKGTLLVMRVVLWHGKDYGTHVSDRLAESDPHTMHEDKVILESVLAQNRDAILELHHLADAVSGVKGGNLRRKALKAGDHHRQLSRSTGVDVPFILDILPPGATEEKEAENTSQELADVKRTFSKRGVRLGVYMSILDLSAHEAPAGLKDKWIQQARLRRQFNHAHGQANDRPGLTALPELSRISEVDTNEDLTTKLNTSDSTEQTIPSISESSGVKTPKTPSNVLSNTPTSEVAQQKINSTSPGKSRTVGESSKLRRVLSKISFNTPRSPTSRKSTVEGVKHLSQSSSENDKQRESSYDVDGDGALTGDSGGYPNKKMDAKNNRLKKSFLEQLRQRLERSALDRPDLDK